MLFTLDAVLPIDLDYQKKWQVDQGAPLGRWVQWLIAIDVIFGWLASGLIVGVVGNLIKKD